MPSLNDEVIDDLAKEGVVTPMEVAGGGNELDIVTPLDGNIPEPRRPVTPKEIFGNDVEAGKIPEFEAEFKVVDDRRTKVIDMKDVESMIIGDGGVDRETAVAVEQRFERKLPQNLALESFSKIRSKTNYQDTLRFVKTIIALEESGIQDSLKTFLKSSLDYANVLRAKMDAVYLPLLTDALTRMFQIHRDVLYVEFDPQSFLIPVSDSDECKAFLTEPLKDLKQTSFNFDVLKQNIGSVMFTDIAELVENINLVIFLRAAVMDSTSDPQEDRKEAILMSSSMNLYELMNACNVICDEPERTNILIEQLDNAIHAFEQMVTDVNNFQTSAESDKYIQEKQGSITRAYQLVQYVYDVLTSLYTLISLMNRVCFITRACQNA